MKEHLGVSEETGNVIKRADPLAGGESNVGGNLRPLSVGELKRRIAEELHLKRKNGGLREGTTTSQRSNRGTNPPGSKR